MLINKALRRQVSGCSAIKTQLVIANKPTS